MITSDDDSSYFDFLGVTCFLFGLILSGISVINLIVAEKKSGALKVLRVMGMKEITYWTSWWTCFALFFFVVATALVAVAKLMTRIRVFTHSDFSVLVFVHWCFLLNYSTWSLFFSALVKNTKDLLT